MLRRKARWTRIAVHVGAWLPLASLAWMTGQGRLGPVPVAAVTRLSGRYALAFLLLSLFPTAVRIVSGVKWALRFRKTLGLYAFFYALLHVLAFVGLDYRCAFDLIVTVVLESRREAVGAAAFVILAVMATTSMPLLARHLGRNWRRIQRSVYLAAALVVHHTVWNYKELRSWPLMAGGTLLLLLIVRLPPVAKLFARWRGSE